MRQLAFPFVRSRNRARKYTDAQRNIWVQMYQNGSSFRQIQEACGAHYATIAWYITKRLKLSDGRPVGRRKQHIGWTDKDIVNNARLKLNYGIDLATYNALLVVQGGVCLICGCPPRCGKTSSSALHVDHDHKTGAIRGLLCGRCNPGLGYFDENPELLDRAAVYLKSHQHDRVA